MTTPAALPSVRGRWLRRISLLLVLGVLAGLGAGVVSRDAGTWLVREDPVEPADALLASIGGWYAGAVEAARLQRTGIAPRIAVTRWASGPSGADADLRRLGITIPTPPDVVQSIFERSGITTTSIERINHEVDGTGPDIATLAAYTQSRNWKRVQVVTSRSHSRRVGWLLERALPADVIVHVHSPSNDPFDPATWWHSREMTREVIIESLRWVNALVLSDPWRD